MNYRYFFWILSLFGFFIQAEAVEQFSRALQSIISEPGVTGSWIVENYKNTLQGFDIKNHIFEFKVLRKSGVECAFHAQRNLVYILKMVQSPREQFKGLYHEMLSEKSYKLFRNITGEKEAACYRHFTVEQFEEFKKKEPKALPQLPNPFYTIHVSANDQQIFKYSFKQLIVALGKFYQNAASSIGFDLSQNAHATTLVVSKQSDAVDYFFADSLGGGITSLAKEIIDLFNNPKEFKTLLLELSVENITQAPDLKALYELEDKKNEEVEGDIIEYGYWKGHKYIFSPKYGPKKKRYSEEERKQFTVQQQQLLDSLSFTAQQWDYVVESKLFDDLEAYHNHYKPLVEKLLGEVKENYTKALEDFKDLK